MASQAHSRNYANANVLSFPYHPTLIAALKAEIPARSRHYDPDRREWTVMAPYQGHAVSLLLKFFPDAIVEAAEGGSPPVRPPRPLAESRHYAALHLLPTAPKEVVRAAYLALAKIHHPDTLSALPAPERDRAHLLMVEINGAIEALRAEGRA